MDGLIVDENNENKNENFVKVKEEKVSKEEEEKISQLSLSNKNRKEIEYISNNKYDKENVKIEKFTDNLNFENSEENNKNDKNNKINIENFSNEENVIPNPAVKDQKFEEKNNNSEIKKDIENENFDSIKINDVKREEVKINQLNINNTDKSINSNTSKNNSRKMHLKKLKILDNNSKDNLKENPAERIISSQKKIEKSNTLDEIGKISAAKIHRDANRILKQINKFNKNTKFCPCCCLPCPTKGVLVCFSYCDDTVDFIETGQGISLYFFFFKYSMIIMAATAIINGILFLIFSYLFSYALKKFIKNIIETDLVKH